MTDATALKLIVEDASGQRTVVPVVLDPKGELLIGRGSECGLRLNERNVSRTHAKLALIDGAFVVVDLGAYNGVRVNGTRIEGQQAVQIGDGVRIGDFQLELRQADAPGQEITKPTLLIGADEGTEPEGEQRALVRKLAEEPTTPGPTAQGATQVAAKVSPMQLGEEPTEILPRNEEAAQAAPLVPPFAHFVCIIGEQAGRSYALDRASIVIGRTSDNDIAIDHRSMSRHHAKITVAQGRYRIVDLDSANGLLVNDEAYTDTELKHGDVAELGHVKLRFVAPAQPTVLTAEEREQVQEQRRPSRKATVGRRAPLAAAAALATGIVGSYIYLARAPDPTAGLNPAAVGGSTEEQHLLMQARQALAQRNCSRAEALAGAVLELEPTRDEARQILSQCAAERKGRDQLEVANAAVAKENWAQAYEALKEVPKASSANGRATALLEQVRPSLLAMHVLAVKRACQAERFDEAERALASLEALQVGQAQATELRDAIESGKKARANRTSEPAAASNTSGAPGGSKAHDSSRSSRAATDEPRQLYADGLHALSQGHADRAVELLLRCVSQDKNYARCHRALGIAYAKMGNGPKAVRYYRQYLKVDPQAKDAASVRQLLQQYDSAQEHGAQSAPAAAGTGSSVGVPQAP